jgi:hypothetical protein
MRKIQKLKKLIQDAEKSGASAAAIISTTEIVMANICGLVLIY